MRTMIVLLVAATTVAGCAEQQRAQLARDARTSMIGMTKEQALACMGPPSNKATEGATEAWSYSSSDELTSGGWRGSSMTVLKRLCTVNISMAAGRISRVDYLPPEGGVLTPCFYAIQNCVKPAL
jgi:hypothetical protein